MSFENIEETTDTSNDNIRQKQTTDLNTRIASMHMLVPETQPAVINETTGILLNVIDTNMMQSSMEEQEDTEYKSVQQEAMEQVIKAPAELCVMAEEVFEHYIEGVDVTEITESAHSWACKQVKYNGKWYISNGPIMLCSDFIDGFPVATCTEAETRYLDVLNNLTYTKISTKYVYNAKRTYKNMRTEYMQTQNKQRMTNTLENKVQMQKTGTFDIEISNKDERYMFSSIYMTDAIKLVGSVLILEIVKQDNGAVLRISGPNGTAYVLSRKGGE